jgi:hypothetical protein
MQNAQWEMGKIKSIPEGLNENSPVRQCGERKGLGNDALIIDCRMLNYC